MAKLRNHVRSGIRGLRRARLQALHRHALVRTVDGVLRRRRHVVLVVLREDFARVERAVGGERALRDHALAFPEEIGKESRVHDGNGLRGIRHAKAHGQRIRVARETAAFDQPTDPERPPLRRFAIRDLRRREEEHEIRLKRVQYEGGSDADHHDARTDPRKALVPRLHAVPAGSSDERVVTGISGSANFASTSVRCRRVRSVHSSTTITSAVTPYAIQTYHAYPPIARKLLIPPACAPQATAIAISRRAPDRR